VFRLTLGPFLNHTIILLLKLKKTKFEPNKISFIAVFVKIQFHKFKDGRHGKNIKWHFVKMIVRNTYTYSGSLCQKTFLNPYLPNPVVPNLFWLVEHLSTGKVLVEHFRCKKPLTEHLNPKILHFCMNFKVSKNLTEHLGPACGTLVFRGTVVGNHWPNLTPNHPSVLSCIS